jgi:hypothetical protein
VHERQKKQNKEWVEANREKVRQYHKEYFYKKIKNSDAYKEHFKSYLKRKELLKNAIIEKINNLI